MTLMNKAQKKLDYIILSNSKKIPLILRLNKFSKNSEFSKKVKTSIIKVQKYNSNYVIKKKSHKFF